MTHITRRHVDRSNIEQLEQLQKVDEGFTSSFLEAKFEDIELKGKKTLFILGNGFDLMHGVPSNYSDFKKFLKQESLKDPDNETIINLMHFLKYYTDVDDGWGNLEEALGNFDFFTEFNPKDLKELLLPAHRIDAENFDEQRIGYIGAGLAKLMGFGAETIVENLSFYLRDWAQGLEIDPARKPLDKIFGQCVNCKFLCFNYTDFIETHYGILSNQVCFIHGCARAPISRGNEEMVIGFRPEKVNREPLEKLHDEVNHMHGIDYKIAKKAEEVLDKLFDHYVEKLSKHYDQNIENHKAFWGSLDDIEQIIVIGHSLAEVDWPYFKEIIHRAHDVEWYFTYYNSKSNIAKFAREMGIKRGSLICTKNP